MNFLDNGRFNHQFFFFLIQFCPFRNNHYDTVYTAPSQNRDNPPGKHVVPVLYIFNRTLAGFQDLFDPGKMKLAAVNIFSRQASEPSPQLHDALRHIISISDRTIAIDKNDAILQR